MNTARLLSVLAASSIAAVAYAQTQTAPATSPSTQSPAAQSNTAPPAAAPAPGYNTSSPSSASSPHQRAVTGMHSREAQPNANPGPTAASSPHQSRSLRMAEAGAGGGAQSWSNMPVESSSGQSLGSVSTVVPGLDGKESSGYVVVSGSNGMSVPVPYRTASSMVRDGKLVLSQSRLEHAPKVTQEDMQNSADHAWRMKADHYWRAAGHGHSTHPQP